MAKGNATGNRRSGGAGGRAGRGGGAAADLSGRDQADLEAEDRRLDRELAMLNEQMAYHTRRQNTNPDEYAPGGIYGGQRPIRDLADEMRPLEAQRAVIQRELLRRRDSAEAARRDAQERAQRELRRRDPVADFEATLGDVGMERFIRSNGAYRNANRPSDEEVQSTLDGRVLTYSRSRRVNTFYRVERSGPEGNRTFKLRPDYAEDIDTGRVYRPNADGELPYEVRNQRV